MFDERVRSADFNGTWNMKVKLETGDWRVFLKIFFNDLMYNVVGGRGKN